MYRDLLGGIEGVRRDRRMPDLSDDVGVASPQARPGEERGADPQADVDHSGPVGDGGGIAPAARRPLAGAEKLAAFLARAADLPGFVGTSAGSTGCPAPASTSMA